LTKSSRFSRVSDLDPDLWSPWIRIWNRISIFWSLRGSDPDQDLHFAPDAELCFYFFHVKKPQFFGGKNQALDPDSHEIDRYGSETLRFSLTSRSKAQFIAKQGKACLISLFQAKGILHLLMELKDSLTHPLLLPIPRLWNLLHLL